MPSGWIHTDDNPSAGCTSGAIWTITEYATMQLGDVLDVCADAPVPQHWVTLYKHWDRNRCGHPASVVENVMTIHRYE